MRAINGKAADVMKRIFAIGNDEHCFKIDNSQGAFMPVVVEFLGSQFVRGLGEIKKYSIAHYYEQNGDLMADPEMCFFIHNTCFYPYYFKQDGITCPIGAEDMLTDGFNYNEQTSIVFDDGIRGRWKMQKDHVSFLEMWLSNIKEQQGI